MCGSPCAQPQKKEKKEGKRERMLSVGPHRFVPHRQQGSTRAHIQAAGLHVPLLWRTCIRAFHLIPIFTRACRLPAASLYRFFWTYVVAQLRVVLDVVGSVDRCCSFQQRRRNVHRLPCCIGHLLGSWSLHLVHSLDRLQKKRHVSICQLMHISMYLCRLCR